MCYILYSTLTSLQKKNNEFSEAVFFFKSVIQGVFWKDNAKGFLNKYSRMPLHISKWAEIAPKDIPNLKKKVFEAKSEAVLAKFDK